MKKLSNAEDDIPVWARSSAFLLKPDSSPYGYIDSKGHKHSAESEEDLVSQLEKSRSSFDYLWTPDDERLVVPEQVEFAHAVLRKRQSVNSDLDVSNGLRMSGLFGLMFLWTVYSAWQKGHGDFTAIYSSQFVGLSALLLLIFGLLPLYSGWKLRRHLKNTKSNSLFDEVPDAQFESWLDKQKAPVTYALIGGLAFCLLVQLYLELGSFSFDKSIIEAGLLKTTAPNYPQVNDGTDWWRLFTAPMLHGNVIHFLMNAAGLLYLGRRIELLARWPHVFIVFLCGMWAGGLSSYYWVPDKIAVGASGGLTGMLGFLLVFEILHSKLAPRPARRRLLAGVVLMAITGILGVSFIDNAAHAGGLLAGVIYALIVFPPSKSPLRPVTMKRDAVGGFLAGVFLFAMVILAIMKMLD